MDLTRPISYPLGSPREFDFNSLDLGAGTDATDGCSVDHVEMGDVQIVGYTEKAALKDGQDASDVYEGARQITLHGTLYGRTRGALYANLRTMRYAINPRLAYNESPPDRGYLPLAFYEPTDDTSEWPGGLIPMMAKVRAVTGVQVTFDRSASGGNDGQGINLPYSVSFQAKDPRIYALDRVEEYISGASGSPTLINRGGLQVPLNIILVADANASNDRIFTFVGGNTSFSVTIPKGGTPTVMRLDAELRVITMGQDDSEVLAADKRSINDWPMLDNGINATLWTFKKDDGTDASLKNTSLMWFREALG